MSSLPWRTTVALPQPGQRTPSDQRCCRTRAKHLASSINDARFTRSGHARHPYSRTTQTQPLNAPLVPAQTHHPETRQEPQNIETFTSWTGWSQGPGGGLTPDLPAATPFKRFLYAFVRGTDNRIYLNRLRGFLWSGWAKVPGGGVTPSGPAATSYRNHIYLLSAAPTTPSTSTDFKPTRIAAGLDASVEPPPGRRRVSVSLVRCSARLRHSG